MIRSMMFDLLSSGACLVETAVQGLETALTGSEL